MARYLGPERFGQYNFALSIITISSVFVTLGLDRILIKEFASKSINKDILLGSGLWIKFTGSIIGYLLAIFICVLTPDTDTETRSLVLLMGLSYLFRLSECIEIWFQSELKLEIAARAKLIALLISSLIKCTLIFYEFSLISFGVILTVEMAVISLFLTIAYVKTGERLSFLSFRFDVVKSLISQSWPLLFSALSGILYTQIDKLMIGANLGMKELAFYAVYLQIMMIPRLFIASLNMSFSTMVSQKYAAGDNGFWTFLTRVLTINTWIAFLATILLTVFGVPLIKVLFGNDFCYDSYALPMIIAISYVIQAPGSFRVEYLILSSDAKTIFYFRIIALLCNISLNYLLLPIYGILGTAISGLITTIFYEIILNSIPLQSRNYQKVYLISLCNAITQKPLVKLKDHCPIKGIFK